MTVLVLSTGSFIRAEVTATHDTIINFDSRLFPRELPRSSMAPVGIVIEGNLQARGKQEPPPLTRLQIAINKSGQLSYQDLPVCRISHLEPATSAEAMSACKKSKIGYGDIKVQSTFPEQGHFFIDGRVTIFNGRYKNGSPAILLHVFSVEPSSSFIFPLAISRQAGRYGTTLTANVQLNRWSRIVDFKLILHRVFRFRGEEKSFLSASCPAPQGFSIGIAPFVQATLGFGDGTESRTTVVGSCKVAS